MNFHDLKRPRLGAKSSGIVSGLGLLLLACGGTPDGVTDATMSDAKVEATVEGSVEAGIAFNPTCTGEGGTSACGKPQSIIRTVVKLGDGMPDTTGNIIITLAHLRFGDLASGGEPHTWATKKGATVAASTPVEIDFDMCAGGAMWSEENCEFNLWGFVDVNLNNVLDIGEPAGRTVVNVSCKTAGPQCFGIVFDCMTGATCPSVNTSPTCQCAVDGCNSTISHCTP